MSSSMSFCPLFSLQKAKSFQYSIYSLFAAAFSYTLTTIPRLLVATARALQFVCPGLQIPLL